MSQPPDRPAPHQLRINGTRQELDYVRHAAKLQGMAVSEFVKRAINDRLVKIGVDAVLFYETDAQPPTPAQPETSARQRGLYGKYSVTRNDGADRHGCKHDGCEYFMLDLTHDRHAIPALKAYARSCRSEFPALSDDLAKIVAVKAGAFFQRQRSRSDD